MTKFQGGPRMTAWHADGGGQGLPYILVIGEAPLAADLITQLMFKHICKARASMVIAKCSKIGLTGHTPNF